MYNMYVDRNYVPVLLTITIKPNTFSSLPHLCTHALINHKALHKPIRQQRALHLSH